MDKSIIFYDSSKTSDDRFIIEDFVCKNKLSYKFAHPCKNGVCEN